MVQVQYIVGATADDEHTVTIEFNSTAPDFVDNAYLGLTLVLYAEDEVECCGWY